MVKKSAFEVTIYHDMTELIREYPIKNPAWMALDQCFVAEMPLLRLHYRDPWNRPFPNDEPQVVRDGEGEIITWIYKTTVNGQEIICKVFND